jgi:VanZ family protein
MGACRVDLVCFVAGKAVPFIAVSRARSFLKYWLPVMIWMAVIFTASGDSRSFQRSSRILGPLLRWLFPHLPEETLNGIVTFARKCIHLTVYAILAFLFWRALRKPRKADPRPWSWREAGLAVLLVALYAATDELHQQFVPSRIGSPLDVLLDTLGGFAGMLGVGALWRWRHRGRPEVMPVGQDQGRIAD